MNTQRIKSIVLFTLVIMSFVLTTRIWFNISIEGLFVMPQNSPIQADAAYDKENLLKPSKLVVNAGQNHTLLFNNNRDKDYYSFILNGSKDSIRDWLTNYESYTLSTLPKEELREIRKQRSVELIFEYYMDIENIRNLLSIEKNPWNDIESISSIIISPFENKLYIVDENKGRIYQFASTQKSSVLTGVITEVEKRDVFPDGFLYDYYEEDIELYSDFAIAPVSITTMPMLKVTNEIKLDGELDPKIANFFNKEDSSNISKFVDPDGKVTFTDRAEKNVSINAEGALEYFKYNVTPDNDEVTGVEEAMDIAAQFVKDHLDFTYDFYLSKVESGTLGGRMFYKFSFNYKYDGMPVITEFDTGNSAIEVEVLGKEVKRYKRNVRAIEDEEKTVKIMSFNDILNIVWGDLDSKLNASKSESILVINDLYLAYFERNDTLIPVWMVNVKVEDRDRIQHERKYIIGAEEGEVGVILGEQ